MNRRDLLRNLGLAAAGVSLAPFTSAASAAHDLMPPLKPLSKFRYCLNTSTISGQKAGVQQYIDIAGRAGYDGVELWVQDVKDFKESGKSLAALKKLLDDNHLVVEDAIGFAPWMVDDEQQRKAGFAQMKQEMDMMAALGCRRIAAPSSGVQANVTLDLFKVGERYKQLLDLGRQTGVTPQLEFWGSSPVFYTFSQALMAASAANDPDVHILPDVYHLFRGNSGFDCLKMVSGKIIDVIHINDYPSSIARTELQDKDRVYPGDGIAPYKQIITDLSAMGGTKVLSLELFNRDYWKLDPLVIARTGIEKMRNIVASAG